VARKRYGRFRNLEFRLQDVTQPWRLQDQFDGIFIAAALHELPESEREGVLRQSCSALKETGRMVIADINPEASGGKKDVLVSFFRLFERPNLSYLFFKQEEALRKAGFRRIENFPRFFGLLQITVALKLT
jgi:SAM-dependent methyltransferase